MFEFELNQELKDIVTEYDAKILSQDLGRTVKPEEIVQFIREENLFLWVLYGFKFVVMTSSQYQQYCEDIAENEAELARI
jgi:hypothetical protein